MVLFFQTLYITVACYVWLALSLLWTTAADLPMFSVGTSCWQSSRGICMQSGTSSHLPENVSVQVASLKPRELWFPHPVSLWKDGAETHRSTLVIQLLTPRKLLRYMWSLNEEHQLWAWTWPCGFSSRLALLWNRTYTHGGTTPARGWTWDTWIRYRANLSVSSKDLTRLAVRTCGNAITVPKTTFVMEIRTCSKSEGKTWRFNISSPYTSPYFHNGLHSIQVYNSVTVLPIIVYERETRRREREGQEKLSCKAKSKVLLCTGVDSFLFPDWGKIFFFSICFRRRIYKEVYENQMVA